MNKRPWKKLAALILGVAIISSINGCSSIPTAPRLSVPPPLVLPKIHASDLQCLTDDTYVRLRERDVLLRARLETLEAIIRATQ